MNIGTKIIELRSRKGWTQQQLADSLSVSVKSVSDWELKGAKPRRAKILRLANLFSISVECLADDSRSLPPSSITLQVDKAVSELMGKAALLRQIADELELSAKALEGRA